MTAVFECILEMSLTAALVIVVVMLIRLLLRKAPRKYSYALWSVAAFRLVCPVSFRAFFSLFNFTKRLDEGSAETIVPDPVVTPPPPVTSAPYPGPAISVDPEYVFTVTTPVVETPAVATVNWVDVVAIVWLAGLAVLMIYGIISYVRLRRRMSTAVLLEGRVWQSDRVQSPFILGFVRPKIYLPFGLSEEQQRYVLAHEGYHIKRLDHIVRPLSFLILAVHWFNPFVWLAYYLMSRDMEMSCDEKVLSGEENIRKAYSTTLLSFASNRRFPSPSPLAFGESGVKGRIKNALNWRKPRTWVTIIAVILCIVVIIVCAADPLSHPRDWTKSLTVENVEWAELMVNGTDRSYRRLSDEELEELVGLLNGLRRNEMKQPPSLSAWGFPTERMLTICCDGVEYILNLGPAPMTIICKDESVTWGNDDPWFVSNEGLKDFVRNLKESREAELGSSASYVSSRCTYWNPARSDLRVDDSGLSYVIGSDLVEITARSSEEVIARFENPPAWKVLSDSAWGGMFAGNAPDLSAYGQRYICRLSDEYVLVSLDGTLWMLHLVDVPYYDHFVWDSYELTPAGQVKTDPGYYQSVECLFMNPLSSALGTADSGYYYLLQGDELRLVNERTGAAYAHDADGGWQELSDDLLHKMEWGTTVLGDTTLWDTLREEHPMVRLYGNYNQEGNYKFLLNFGHELWVGTYNYDRNGYISLWDLYCLEKMDDSFMIPVEELSIWYADLTHDGVDEVITLQRNTSEIPYIYSITVTTSDGTVLWREEISDWRGGHNGFYLYERDGKSYLMEWYPSDQQGWYNFSYRIFSLNGTGEPVVLAENELQYDLGSYQYEENLLAINTLEVRSFEWEVNALLKDTTALLIIHDGKTVLGDPSNPVSDQWTSPADDWERERIAILKNQEDREARTLAVWPLNDLTLTVLEGEYETYTIDVYNGDYYLWDNSFGHHGGVETLYFRYEENGVQYLMEVLGTGRQGVGMWQYSIFSIGPEGINFILQENILYYENMSAETTLMVDVDEIRAFEAEVNALLDQAELIAGIENGKLIYSTPGAGTVYRWYTGEAERIEQRQQELIADMPLVYCTVATGHTQVRDCAIEQTRLRMGEHEIAYIRSIGEISTGAVGIDSGMYIYRVTYQPMDYDKATAEVTQHESKHFYLITYEVWPNSMTGSEEDAWYFVDTLSEEELQSSFNTPEMLAQYGDPYLAAVVETVNQWRTDQ